MNHETEAQKLRESIDLMRRILARMLGGTRVLVVEDDANDVFLLKRELDKFQCQVTVVSDGEAAVKEIKEHPYDLILLDAMVPKLTGMEVLQETAGFRPNSRVIVVTGYPGSAVIPKTLTEGAVLAFAKPITEEALKLFLTPL